MYVEDTGAGNGDIHVIVSGEEYTAEANYDLDGNGVDETAAVMTDDGFVAYTDADADGRADVVRTFDEQGKVLNQARYDEASGNWVPEQPEQGPPAPHPTEQQGRSMVVDTPQGDREIGPPTEDTDNDGKPDTAIVDVESGQLMVTDVDGDGSADQVVEISDTGEVTVSHHTGNGEWTVVERGHVDDQGSYASESAPSEPDRPGAARSAAGGGADDRAAQDAAWRFEDTSPAATRATWDSDAAWG